MGNMVLVSTPRKSCVPFRFQEPATLYDTFPPFASSRDGINYAPTPRRWPTCCPKTTAVASGKVVSTILKTLLGRCFKPMAIMS